MHIFQVIYCITSRSITLNIYFTTWDLFRSINNFTYNYLTQITFKLLCFFLPIVPNPALNFLLVGSVCSIGSLSAVSLDIFIIIVTVYDYIMYKECCK